MKQSRKQRKLDFIKWAKMFPPSIEEVQFRGKTWIQDIDHEKKLALFWRKYKEHGLNKYIEWFNINHKAMIEKYPDQFTKKKSKK